VCSSDLGDRARVTVKVGGGASLAWRCNLLEEPLDAVEVIDGSVTLELRPFELVTLRFTTL
jgi:alpha-mannosidase